ncbi:hypothetical protein K461DRAFT_318575 [Myriangium duriaei CBS 260.36]|uniref:Uncharacterized protein n=1 Tax=Myriangium duriaei CBS 260.36 TaxID=1168546 RepID=A0A9P4MN68_9PEZI|nr:hypothetical protein K461DRAFT_318575 [Myriangium duriaei CBS 260.36]
MMSSLHLNGLINFRNDRWLWVAFAVFIFGASKGIAHGLKQMVELNTISDDGGDKSTHTAPIPEDSIGQDTLRTLYESPNNDISIAATSLLLKRMLYSTADGEAWLDDFFSTSSKVRQSANQLAELYWQHPQGNGPAAKVVDDLFGLIDLMGKNDSMQARTIRAAYACARHQALLGDVKPMTALRMLSLTMLQDKTKQRIVMCPNMRPAQFAPWVRAVKALMHESSKSKSRLARALGDLHNAPSSSDQTDSIWLDEESIELDIRPLAELRGYSPPPIDLELPSDLRSRPPRFHEESPEETEVRRRRREAMVFHEGTGIIDHNNIYTT